MNDSPAPSVVRLSNDLFNQIAPFGQSYYTSNHVSAVQDPTINTRTEELLAKLEMPSDYCIRFLVQSMIFSEFISRDFPEIGLTTNLQSIIDLNIRSLCQDIFSVTKSLDAIKQTWSKIQGSLVNLAAGVRSGKLGYKDEWSASKREQFMLEIEKFVEAVNQHLKSFEDFLKDVKDDSPTTQEMMIHYFQFVQAEHQSGKEWGCKFFEYAFLNNANLILKHYKIEGDERASLKTHIETLDDEDEGRYIQITFSPQHFLIRDFEKLSLQFFHEYISHLSAGIYQIPQGEDGLHLKDDVLSSFREIPIELDEGWMMHTAQTFIRDKGFELLGRTREHMRANIEGSIDEWIRQLMHPRMEDGKYINRASRGAKLASDFLHFLQLRVCNRDEQRARNLYYRLSFDLITRFPHSNFHLGFMNTLDYWMGGLQDQLVKVIQECLNKESEFIDLDLLWSRIKVQQPHRSL